jgi:hypothetical protein
MFYDYIIYKTIKTTINNEIREEISTYVKGDFIECDIQPASSDLMRKTFGEDIVANYLIFTDELLGVNEILVFDDKSYKIKKLIDWIDYRIYAIESVDINVQG